MMPPRTRPFRLRWPALLAATALIASALAPQVPAAASSRYTRQSGAVRVQTIGLPEAGDGPVISTQAVEREAAALSAAYGGPYAGPQAALMQRVGAQLASQATMARPSGGYHFVLLDSGVENAFSLPGGHIYCTRALLALMNSESELAFALGHEVGHLAAHHAERRMYRTNSDVFLATIGQAVVDGLLWRNNWTPVGRAATAGVGAALLRPVIAADVMRFSREEEFEADDLGARFARSAGYQPGAAALLGALAADTALSQDPAAPAQPRWAMSHPEPEARIARAQALAAKAPTPANAPLPAGALGDEAFLMALNGLPYGDDPAKGVVDGQHFWLPPARLGFTAPAGYAIANSADAVFIAPRQPSPEAAVARFSGGLYAGDLKVYLARVAADFDTGEAPMPPPVAGSSAGLPTLTTHLAMRNAKGQLREVTVVAYALNASLAFSLVIAAPAGSGMGALAPLAASMARMSPAQLHAWRPRQISVVGVGPQDTLASMAARMAVADHPRERFLVLNGLPLATTSLPVGRKVKLVRWVDDEEPAAETPTAAMPAAAVPKSRAPAGHRPARR